MMTRCRPLLGTFVEITTPEGHVSAMDAAFAAITHVHARMSFHQDDSDLALLRKASAGDVVRLDGETIRVLRLALDLHGQSGGLFDVAVAGPALVRSGFLPRCDVARLSDYRGTSADLAILDDRHVRVERRVLVDLGGIAKGHAVDRAVDILQGMGVPEGLVNAGGDLRAFGDRDWPVALRDADDIARISVAARNCAIASSANLLNRRRHRGQPQSPHIGMQGRSVLCDERVTVVVPLCAIADAMTKVAMADMPLAQRLLSTCGGHVLQTPNHESHT